MANWKNTFIHLRPVIGVPALPEEFNLGKCLYSAMRREVEGTKLSDNWELRKYSLSETDVLVMNVLNQSDDEVFCQFASFEQDGLLAIAATKQDDVASNLKINQIQTPDGHDPNKGTSLLYVRGNFALFVDAGVKSSQIERYLNWLVFDSSGDAPDFGIKLSAKFELADGSGNMPVATELNIRPAPVQIPTPLEAQIAAGRPAADSVGSIQASSTRDKVMEILGIIGVGYEQLTDLQDKIGTESVVEMGLTIKVKNKGKLIPVNSFPVEEMARNFDDDAIQLRGKGGTVIGKLVSVKYPTRITCNGSLFDPGDALAQIQAAWSHFVAQKYIL